MFIKILQALKKEYRTIKNLVAPHPLFSTIDKFKLSKIKRDTNKKGFIYLKPKGWLHTIKIRRNFIDKEVVHYVLQDQYHLPPTLSKISANPVILDLGSNIGLTIAHMKQIYPTSKIIGYEMNRENYLLAKRNTKFYDNVIVVNTAVWIEDATVTYRNTANYDSYTILNDTGKKDTDELIEVASLKLSSIITNHNLTHIDYLKMDIEGAEKAILESEDLSWMDKVGAMNIEMHLDQNNDLSKFLAIIENKGFTVWKDSKHWSSIFAVRNTL
ncbi:MAG: FkbM family methyltransferase [Flavobacterium sp.]|nr:FkbM family methyltransferase [Flavobacterium sp.]